MHEAQATNALKRLQQRVDRIEQILPTLATKDDLERAIEPLATREELRRAIEPLATKEELRRAITEAVEPLATKEELRRTIADAVEPLASKSDLAELRSQMMLMFEHLQTQIETLAEHMHRMMARVFPS